MKKYSLIHKINIGGLKMERKLPGVFVNKIEKRINNNETVYYTSNQNHEQSTSVKESAVVQKKIGSIEPNIKQKINELFKSVNYIYKLDVSITLKDQKITKRIIGYNSQDLITFDNERIPIQDILDIEVLKKE